MADLTQGSVDSVVGLLSTVIIHEAKRLKGMQDDLQFIKDEMESMNGFLIHLTKTDRMHDDQLRAWMKQIRDISYIAQDCIERYKRDFPGLTDKGLWARLKYLPKFVESYPARRRLGKRMSELKARVHDIGQRRERYQVKIPEVETPPLTLAEVPPSQDKIDKKREEFLCALARDKEKQQKQELPCCDEELPFVYKVIRPITQFFYKEKELPWFDESISLLDDNKDLKSAAMDVRKCLLENLSHDRRAAVCMEMLLRALCDHSDVHRAVEKTKGELKALVKGAGMDIKDFPTQVMIFCYSKLSRSYKSCLQYLCAFQEETAISRTSLVRRWLAEGRVEKQADASLTLKEVEKQDDASLEEAAEICFKDLLFRGFLRPDDANNSATATCKVKSCTIDDIVWKFLHRMSTTENFVDNMPTHLGYQLRIRKYVNRQEEHVHKNNPPPRHPWSICTCIGSTPPDDSLAADPDPLGDMQKFLKTLNKAHRLNVLDLGGCKGLQKSHLKSICKVKSIKYLSLRNTGVSHLPQEINNLILLETLDIRQTQVQDMKHICLQKLKHLLTNLKMTTEGETLRWAGMPGKIGKMKEMEILSRVEIRHGKQDLEEVARLLKLRKLGVVLVGSQSQAQDSMNNLLQAITKLRESLRSLSIWVTPPHTNVDHSATVIMEEKQGQRAPELLKSLNIRGMHFLNTGLARWILKLKELSEITLCDTFLSRDSLQHLGNNLSHLRCLRLRCNSYMENKLTFSKDGFQDLRFLFVEGDKITTIYFEDCATAPACPQLRKIVWRNLPSNQGMLSGILDREVLEMVELRGDFTDLSSIANNIGCKLRHKISC